MRTKVRSVGLAAVVGIVGVGALVAGGSGPAGAGAGGGDAVVSAPGAPGGPGEESSAPRMVTPRGGMDNVHPIAWERVERRGRWLRVFFTSGVEPCSVLDHVEVDYRPRQIVVTLFEGSDPRARDQACIAKAESKVTDVWLAEPVRGRRVVDGAKADRTEPRPGSDVQGNMTDRRDAASTGGTHSRR